VISFKNPVPKVAGLLALAILLVAGCAKSPKAPNANLPPNTFITSYSIAIPPDSATLYNVTVNWRASDIDGEPESYRYWLDAADPADSLKTSTFDAFVTKRLIFSSSDTTHTFYVQARDNEGTYDPTPASMVVRMTDTRNVHEFLPNTFPVTIPPDGSLTSRGVFMVLNGTSIVGGVVEFQYAVDDTATWTSLPPTLTLSNLSTLEARLGPSVLSWGPHIIFFRAVDNWGNVDESPLSVSINCDSTQHFAPELALSVSEGQKFIVPFTRPVIDTLKIDFSTLVDFYFSAVDHYTVTTSSGIDTTMTVNSLTLTNVEGGSYWIKVAVTDIGENTTIDSTDYIVVVLNAHNGILGINGVDWPTYGTQARNVWRNGVPFGNFPHFKWWDVFTVPPSGGRPFPDSVLGVGSVPSYLFDTLFFSTITWMANEFSGDEVFWNERQTEIMNFLNMGGNVVLATRFGADFFFDDLSAFTGVNSAGWLTGVNPSVLTAVADSLTNINRLAGQSQSLTDLPTVTSAAATKLYEDPNNPSYYAGFITQPAGQGKFVFIAGRNYRWVNADLKSNLDVIYRFYFNMRSQY
jgi:hypothetical protein